MSGAQENLRCMPLPAERPTMKVTDAAALLNCGTASVYQMVHNGTLDTVRIGRKILIKTVSLRRLAGLD